VRPKGRFAFEEWGLGNTKTPNQRQNKQFKFWVIQRLQNQHVTMADACSGFSVKYPRRVILVFLQHLLTVIAQEFLPNAFSVLGDPLGRIGTQGEEFVVRVVERPIHKLRHDVREPKRFILIAQGARHKAVEKIAQNALTATRARVSIAVPRSQGGNRNRFRTGSPRAAVLARRHVVHLAVDGMTGLTVRSRAGSGR
jgi:hypothetical protein